MNHRKRRVARTNADWSEETTQSLVNCAQQQFARLGYEAVSLEQIAQRVGLTKGAIYYHFKSKAGLFEAVFRHAQEQIVKRIEHRAKAATAPTAALLAGCETFVEMALQDDLRQIVLVDAPRVLGWSRWRAIDEELGLQSLQQGLRACVSEASQSQVNVLAHILSGAMNECVFFIADSEDRDAAYQEVMQALRLTVLTAVGKTEHELNLDSIATP
jgi:AcrR family transcriptional regulator